MKDWIIVITIIAIVFGGNYLMKSYLDKTGHEMIAEVEKLSAGLETDTEEEKYQNVEEIKKKWDEAQKIWIMFQYHENVNAMEDLLLSCCNYYIDSDRTEFNINLDHFKRNVEDLKNRMEVSLVNIM
ncbi:MAG: DUF4363 family protein [Clostridia bacterium]|nr:DUF4363 family protein [Clostridia bacterium]